jgi:hypothetical protein
MVSDNSYQSLPSACSSYEITNGAHNCDVAFSVTWVMFGFVEDLRRIECNEELGIVFELGEYVLEATLIERVKCLVQSGRTGKSSLLYWARCKCINEAVSFASTESIDLALCGCMRIQSSPLSNRLTWNLGSCVPSISL